MKQPLVSVIIPAYKAERFIEETITSVIKQSYTCLECIVINDGSPDKLGTIVRRLRNEDSRITYIRQENGGVSSARNHGFKLSKGEYICFLDADDIWLPNRVEKMLALFQLLTKDYGLIHSDISHIDENSKFLGIVQSGLSDRVLNDLLLLKECVIPAPSSIMLRRETIENIGLFNLELSNAADYEFFLRVADTCKVKRIPEVLSYYRVHSSNMSANIKLIEKDQLLAFKIAKKNNLFKNKMFKNHCYSNMYMSLAASFIVDNKMYFLGLKYLAKSIYAYPKNISNLLSKVLKRI